MSVPLTPEEREAMAELVRVHRHENPYLKEGIEIGFLAALSFVHQRAAEGAAHEVERAARAVMDHAEYDDLYGRWRLEGGLLTDPDGVADDALTALAAALAARQPDREDT